MIPSRNVNQQDHPGETLISKVMTRFNIEHQWNISFNFVILFYSSRRQLTDVPDLSRFTQLRYIWLNNNRVGFVIFVMSIIQLKIRFHTTHVMFLYNYTFPEGHSNLISLFPDQAHSWTCVSLLFSRAVPPKQ